jgi:hypothetical protein
MSISTATARLLGAAILAGFVAYAAPARAQQAKFCNNALALNAVYSNLRSNGSTAEVEYHGQFQNMDTSRRTLNANSIRVDRIGSFVVLRQLGRFELASYQQKDITLLAVRVNNPGGNGAPTSAQVAAALKVVCTFS